MKRVLYISAFIPCKNGRHAGARAAHENLTRLRASSEAVDPVICTTESTVEAPAPSNITVFRHRLTDLFLYLLSHANTLGLRASLTAGFIHTRLNKHAEAELIKLLRTHAYDEVFVDFTQAICLIKHALDAACIQRPTVTLCLHDIFAQRVLRTSNKFVTLLAGLVLKEEQLLVTYADKVLTLSEKDRQLVSALYALENVEVKPFQPPAWASDVSRHSQSIRKGRLIFFGNFDRIENSSAAEWFAHHALPAIIAAEPKTSLILVGTGSDRLAKSIGSEHITGTGFIENPSAYFSECEVAIAPLTLGAGVKFKVLEALSCKVPVIGTSIACEGIEGQPLLQKTTLAEFSDAVIAHLRA